MIRGIHLSSHSQSFFYGLGRLKNIQGNCVATIGTFDGVHLGHQIILKKLIERAKADNLPSCAIIFEPQPNEFFSKDIPPARLSRLREKVAKFFNAGVNYVVCLKFNLELRSFTAEKFVTDILVDGIKIHHLIIGDDFQFGCDRKGNYEMLQQSGVENHFTVENTPTQLMHGERISSTKIRLLLAKGNVQAASELLGDFYSICGKVSYGKQLGRTLNFPTVNIALGRKTSPFLGVFAVKVHIYKSNEVLNGVANLGYRPTVNGSTFPLLEVHILDKDLQLYGKTLRVEFLKKIRDEKQFSGLDALKEQINKDVINTRIFFNTLNNSNSSD